MNDTPKTHAVCQAIQKSGVDWHHSAKLVADHARGLELENNRMRWLLRQIVTDLPQKRDWLNPDHEREMRALANSKAEP